MEKTVTSPLVSVLMCVYNAEKYLSESIESILNQSYRNFELIIVNDGSTDKSLQRIREYSDKRIRVYSRANKGISVSRNEAISKAKGEYIAWQDADDISLSNRLEVQVNYLNKNRTIGILGSNYEVINEESVTINKTDVFTNPTDLKLALILFNDIGQGTVMFRKQVIDELNYDSTFKLGEDYDLWTRATHVTDVANIKDSLYKWRYYQSSSWTSNRDEMKKYVSSIRDREFKFFLIHKKSYTLASFHPFTTRGGPKKYCEKKSLIFRNLTLLYGYKNAKTDALRMSLVAVIYAPWIRKNYTFLKAAIFNNKFLEKLEYEGI